MTWFLTRDEAEAALATVERLPDYDYSISRNGCGPDAYGIAVHDPDGVLITESYTPGDLIPLHQVSRVSEAEYRELRTRHAHRRR